MNLELIKTEMQKFQNNHVFLQNMSEEHIFALMSAVYYYFDGDFTKAQYTNIFVDGSYDGGLDVIFNDELSDDNDLIMFQSKFSENLDKNDILDIFEKMHRTFVDLKKGQYQKYNEKVTEAFTNCNDAKGDSANDYLVLATIYSPREKTRREIDNLIKNNSNLRKYKILIYYGDDIETRISSIAERKEYVEHDKIRFFKTHGKVNLDNGDGAVVNVSACDLKRLYAKYKTNGLFNKNLRFYIKQKSVDEGILDTLKSNVQEFWFKNNGIIIGCDDFNFDGDNIKLDKFSIINGAQTTSLIGTSEYVDETNDFPIVCKLIKYETDEFLNEVAEASNSQKPINERDLMANKPEQRKLQDDFKKHNPPIFMEIKRGEKRPSKAKYPESWQRTKNETIGQLLLSFTFQRPGTARGNKKTIFSVKSTYDMIFRREHDIDTLVDMLRLKDIYDNYLNKQSDALSKLQKGIAKNGTYCILALIGFFIKLKRNKINEQAIKLIISEEHQKEVDDIIDRDDISGSLISSNDNYIQKIEELIYELLDLVADKYERVEAAGKTTSYSNFLKTDLTYQTSILPYVLEKYKNKPSIKKTIDDLLEVFM